MSSSSSLGSGRLSNTSPDKITWHVEHAQTPSQAPGGVFGTSRPTSRIVRKFHRVLPVSNTQTRLRFRALWSMGKTFRSQKSFPERQRLLAVGRAGALPTFQSESKKPQPSNIRESYSKSTQCSFVDDPWSARPVHMKHASLV